MADAYRMPGVYTRTLYDPRSVNIAGLDRLAVLIGEGRETFEAEDVPLVRGSSAYLDIPVTEDLSSQVNGITDTFTMSYTPITKGDGTHKVSDSVYDVQVMVGQESVVPISLNAATGVFILPVIPEAETKLRVQYYYTRADLLVTAEDLSAQADSTNRVFYTTQRPIVEGNGSGIPAVETRFVSVTVDSVAAAVTSVDGANGKIILTSAPTQGAVVKVTYYTNTWRNTYDHLEHTGVTEAIRCGNLPLQTLYVEGTDFILVDDKIFWGNAVYVRSYVHTPGETEFSDNKISASLVDTWRIMESASGSINGTNRTFSISEIPMDGASRPTYDPSKIEVYIGATPIAAFEAGKVVVASLDADTQLFTLATSVTAPSSPNHVYATYQYSRIADEDYEFKAADPDSDLYTVTSLTAQKPVPLVALKEDEGEGTDWSVADVGFVNPHNGIRFPHAVNDLWAPVANAVEENVTVTFGPPTSPYSAVTADEGNTGVADIVVSGTYTGTADLSILIEVDGVDPDTVKWSLDDGSTWEESTVALNGTTPVALTGADGVAIAGATDGHVAGDQFTFTVSAATTNFTVTSDSASGSAGTGTLDAVYEDAVTGLTFTVLSTLAAWHATTGNAVDGVALSDMVGLQYVNGDYFTISVLTTSGEFSAAGSSTVYRSIPGITFSVANLDSIEINDSALVSTYHRQGQEPNVGDQYYVTYSYPKDDEDYEPQVYTKMEDIILAYGPVAPSSPLSLAAHLAFSNGAAAIGCVQVPRATNSQYGSLEAYEAAVDMLKKPFRNGIEPDLLVPLRYNADLVAYIERHVDLMSSDRYRSERVAYIGFADGVTTDTARQIAAGFTNVRITFVYPDAFVISLEDEQGFERESLVSGCFAAAAYAGLQTSPQYDPATPMTNKALAGFTRWGRRLDPVEMDILATSGITIIHDRNPRMVVRHATTSDVSGVLQREQNIVWIVHFTQKRGREALAPFIGVKFLDQILPDIEAKMQTFLQGLRDREIIRSYRNIRATADEADPTQANVQAEIMPVFALNYLQVTFSLRTRM